MFILLLFFSSNQHVSGLLSHWTTANAHIETNADNFKLNKFDLTLTFHVPNPSCGINLPLFNVMLGTCDAAIAFNLTGSIYGKLLSVSRLFAQNNWYVTINCSQRATNADWMNSCILSGYMTTCKRAETSNFSKTLK